MRRRQFEVAGIKEIFEHPEQIEVYKARLPAEQKGVVGQHFIKWQQSLFQQLKPVILLFAPLVNAAAAEFALLETQKLKLFRRRDIFPPVNVVQPEGGAFNLVFDGAPEDGLDAFEFSRKKSEVQFLVEIFGDDL